LEEEGLSMKLSLSLSLSLSIYIYIYIYINKAASQIRTKVRVRVFNARLPVRNQYASVIPATGDLDQGFFVVFLGPRANAELVPKTHVTLHASHAGLTKFISK
jgi:hypothetical protein